jgi:hypothetical protein
MESEAVPLRMQRLGHRLWLISLPNTHASGVSDPAMIERAQFLRKTFVTDNTTKNVNLGEMGC